MPGEAGLPIVAKSTEAKSKASKPGPNGQAIRRQKEGRRTWVEAQLPRSPGSALVVWFPAGHAGVSTLRPNIGPVDLDAPVCCCWVQHVWRPKTHDGGLVSLVVQFRSNTGPFCPVEGADEALVGGGVSPEIYALTTRQACTWLAPPFATGLHSP